MPNADTSGSKFDKRAAALRANLMRRKKAGREIANNAASVEQASADGEAADEKQDDK